MRDEQQARQNGQRSGEAESADADGDDNMDDDMMDKISSSPSISDGGYSQFTTMLTPRWPKRSSSLCTPTPPSKSADQGNGANSSSDVVDSDESSPFVTTLAPLPVSLSTPRPASPFPFRSALSRTWAQPSTPLSKEGELESEQSSSPFIESPAHFPLHYHDNSSKVQSESHHHCEVGTDEALSEAQDTSWTYEERGRARGHAQAEAKTASAAPSMDKELGVWKMEDLYQPLKLARLASDIEFEAQLLPVDDPLLDDAFFDSEGSSVAPTVLSENENEWETESETKYSEDSFESDAYNSDDETQDRKFLTDDHFIDSSWRDECLRETEDIDFEFVYALHTFVATVEGQANAQKGDTMVLLDDSNSYWWLVRVVKDSTIGLSSHIIYFQHMLTSMCAGYLPG
jgi:hypothetical protein